MVNIKDVGEFGAGFYDEMLLTFVGQAYACLTGEQIFNQEKLWRVINFSPKEQTIEVEKVKKDEFAKRGY